MHEAIKKAVEQAEEIVKASKVDDQFATSAYEIILTHLLRMNKNADRPFDSNRVKRFSKQRSYRPDGYHGTREPRDRESISTYRPRPRSPRDGKSQGGERTSYRNTRDRNSS